MLSGAPDPAMEERARKGEIAALLRKPVDTEALFRAVQAAMEKTPRRNIRIAAYLPAVLEDGGPAAEGVVSVLSEYGMFFRTLEPRALHARVPVSISLPKGPGPSGGPGPVHLRVQGRSFPRAGYGHEVRDDQRRRPAAHPVLYTGTGRVGSEE
jgi:hypothetical protein